MKTEFLKKLLPESLENRDDIIGKIFAENGRDVEAEKAKHADYESVQTALAEAQQTITTLEQSIKTLEASSGDVAALQKQIDDYKAADEQRRIDEQVAKTRQEVEARFTTVTGDRKFIHDYVRQGVLTDFEKALSAQDYRGKGDQEIFDALTKDKDYFASQNPAAKMGGAGSVGGDDAIDARAVMGLPPLEK